MIDSHPCDPPSNGDGSAIERPSSETGDAARLQANAAVDLSSMRPISSAPKPGPGVFEAAVWAFGVPCVHLAAVIGLMLMLTLVSALVTGPINVRVLLESGQDLLLPVLLGGEMLIFVIVAVTAVLFRLGAQPARKLALNGFGLLHGLIMVALLLPISVISGEVYRIVDLKHWQPLTHAFPFLGMLDGANSMNSIADLAGRLPLSALLLCLAVAPAIGEEVVCRGLIGRGLIARWGLPLGILGSTLLFAAIHVHPVHAVAVIPLGLCMHVLYVATRSFWAPVCYHFLNNAWACVMMTEGGQADAAAAAAAVGVASWMLAVGSVLCLAYLLWQTRVRYLLEDGTEWTPGYPSLERPPAMLGLHPSRRRPSAVALTVSLACWIGFLYCA